jgi:hypothetical protein
MTDGYLKHATPDNEEFHPHAPQQLLLGTLPQHVPDEVQKRRIKWLRVKGDAKDAESTAHERCVHTTATNIMTDTNCMTRNMGKQGCCPSQKDGFSKR